MGLDTYAYSLPGSFCIRKARKHIFTEQDPFCYWRKAYILHHLLTELYTERTGKDLYNEELLQLSLEDLELIKNNVLNIEDVYETFHPMSYHLYTVDNLAKDLHFIEQSKAFITQGQNVYIISSW